MSEAPMVSLVICTRNRASQLAACLASVRALRFDGQWELIVVDNGSTDETRATIKQNLEDVSFTVRVVEEPRPGLARARNRGLGAAAGEIVAFTDDDCYPATDYLQIVSTLFAENAIGFAGGRVLLYDPADAKVTVQERQHPEVIAPRSFIPAGLIHGANMAFDREALLEVRGFDERLGAGRYFSSGEDTDVIRRLSCEGRKGYYEPRLVVHHHHGRDAKAGERQERAYDRGRAVGMLKHSLKAETRTLYLREWYWHLRRTDARTTWRELWFSLIFLARYGCSRSGVWNHPHESLGDLGVDK